MLDAFKDFFNIPTKSGKSKPDFFSLSVNDQEQVIANISFGVFENFISTASQMSVIQIIYSGVILKEDKFNYRIPKGSEKKILKIFVKQLFNAALQVYFSSLLFDYYKNFYSKNFVTPTINLDHDPTTFNVSLVNIANTNSLIKILETGVYSSSISKYYNTKNKSFIKLSTVMDIDTIAAKIFMLASVITSTFSNKTVYEFMDDFIKDYISNLEKEPKNILTAFYFFYAYSFNRRKWTLFYKEDDKVEMVNNAIITPELYLANCVYKYFVSNHAEDFNVKLIEPSFQLQGDNHLEKFHTAILNEIKTFVDKASLISSKLEANEFTGNKQVIDPELNIIDLTDRFQKSRIKNNHLKEKNDVKSKLT